MTYFKNKTVIMSGGSRGVGLEIAKALGKDGANIAILAKTTEPHPTLPGTIFTAADEIEEVGEVPLRDGHLGALVSLPEREGSQPVQRLRGQRLGG